MRTFGIIEVNSLFFGGNLVSVLELEITFTEESNNFFKDVQSLKGKIDISVWDRTILILKKSEVYL